MENFYQWLIIFSGTTISFLGCLLYWSARKEKRSETGQSRRPEGRVQSTQPEQVRPFPEFHSGRFESEAERAGGSKLAELKVQLAEKEKVIAELQSAAAYTTAMRAQAEETSLKNRQLEAEVDDLRNQLQTAHRRLNETFAQNESWLKREAEWTAQMARSKLEIEKLIAENHGLRTQVHTLSSQLAASENRIQELRAVQEQAQAKVHELQCEIAGYREQLETTQSALEKFKKLNQQATVQIEALEARVGELERESNEKGAVIERLQSEAQELRSRGEDLDKELERRQKQLIGTEAQMEEALSQKREALERCARLQAEAADLTQRVEDGRSKARELEIAQQRIVELESREMFYREQQERLEALVADLERDLALSKGQSQALEEAHERLHEAERVCQELREENRRLGEETLRWQEQLKTQEQNQNQVKMLRRQLEESQRARAQAGREIDLFANPLNLDGDSRAIPFSPGSDDTKDSAGGDETVASSFAPALAQRAASRSADDRAWLVATLDKSETQKAGQPGRPSARRHWRFAVVGGAVIIFVLAGAIGGGFFGAHWWIPPELGGSPDANSNDYTAETIAKVRERPLPRLRGTFEAIRATGVYSERSENSALVATIERGTKLNVVDSRDGWLEIRSKHGRPPGFVREEAAVRIKD